MKSTSRRQVKTPVGNKTKRGAELEGSPKTPRSLEASPAKPSCADGSSFEPDDRRLQLRSRRPLQWNIITKQRIVGDSELGENTMSPSQQQAQQKCTGESKAIAALSPICVNAIHRNAGQHGGAAKNTCIKKPNELSPAVVLSQSVRNYDAGPDRVCHGKAKAVDRRGRRDEDDARSTDEGSCPSSPDVPSSHGKQMFFWSNAAFNTHEPGLQEAVSVSKDAASSSSFSSSASSSRQNEAGIARADSVAESKFSDSSAEDRCTEKNGTESCRDDGGQKGAMSMLPEARATIDPVQTASNSSLKVAENVKSEHANGFKTNLSDVSSSTKKNLFESGGKSSLAANNLEAGRIDFPPYFSSPATKQSQIGKKCDLQAAGDAAEDEEAVMKGGLDEIQQEIERLTERLAELHVQKRKREEEIQRRKQAKNEIVEKSGQEKRARAAGVGEKMKEINGAGSSRSPFERQKQPQKAHGLASRSREESPLAAQARRRAQGSTASVSKLSEMRRSVSSTSRRIERSNGDERTKVLRRLSLSGAATTSATSSESKSQQQGVIKPLQSSKSTPSRVVSSRYGRAITPDACRPCAPALSTPSKKRDRPSSASAASSPLPAQPPPSPSPTASVACSPLKRAATLRSGYPSRSGFSTPTKDRQAASKSTAMVSSSVQLPPSTLSSSLTKSQDRTRPLLSSPRCMSPLPRLDSPKSTAALYKCLESLLEDSKHFFKRLSPARPKRLPDAIASAGAVVAVSPASTVTTLSACDCSPKQLLAAMENTLPTINTCRLDAMTPRDSGCVKRAADRQKKRFYFAQEEDCIPHAPEAAMSAQGISST